MLLALSGENFFILVVSVVPPVLTAIACWKLWRWSQRADREAARERAEHPELYNSPD